MNNKFTIRPSGKQALLCAGKKRRKMTRHSLFHLLQFNFVYTFGFFLRFQSPVFTSSFTVFSPHRNALNTALLLSHWPTADERKKGTTAEAKKGNTCKYCSTGSNKKKRTPS